MCKHTIIYDMPIYIYFDVKNPFPKFVNFFYYITQLTLIQPMYKRNRSTFLSPAGICKCL